MPLVVRNLFLSLDEDESRLLERAARKLRVRPDEVRAWAVSSRAVDARKRQVHFVYQLEVALASPDDEPEVARRALGHDVALLRPRKAEAPVPGSEPLRHRPVVVGFGPGGMFAAHRLAQYGYAPIVLERGRDVRRRHRDIMQRFYREHDFDPQSNLLFGEGGAGTYSDGKLYTRVNDPLSREVLELLYRHGADPDILINTRPHVGSDRLPTICTHLRRTIVELGGEVRFDTTLADVKISDGSLAGLVCRTADESEEHLPCDTAIVAIGHSARDTIRMLHDRGVTIVTKPFQVGVRIEHPQAMIDRRQYGAAAGHHRLGPAEYHLVARGAAEAGDLFSFCMCPGGQILPTNESPGLVCTNGASRANRSGQFANSGLVITQSPDDLGFTAMQALDYLEAIERRAFEIGGGDYAVPCQRAVDFLSNRSSEGLLETSYPLGGRWADLTGLLPAAVVEALRRGLATLDRKIPGYAGEDAIITAPETRASAPLRIVREHATRSSPSVEGLYPVGEGAGYAGGIISAAIDGIRSADAIIARYAPPV